MITIVNVKNLVRVFGEKRAIDGINFDVKEGEIFGFLGTNGAGKTTTIRVLTGQLLPTYGDISICGIDPGKERELLSLKIGVVPEIPNLYSDISVEENLNIFAGIYSIARERVKQLLMELKLSEYRKYQIKKLSKGLKQRVLIARALIHNPVLLFLDEPTSGLDPNYAIEIRTMLREMKEHGKTIFLTTHYMHEAEELCDRIAIINRGRIVAAGRPRDLIMDYSSKEIVVETVSGTKQFSFNELDKIACLNSSDIYTVHSTEPSLEKVFIKLTGRKP